MKLNQVDISNESLAYNQSLMLSYIQKAFRKSNYEMAKSIGYKSTRSWERAKSGSVLINYTTVLMLQKVFDINFIDFVSGKLTMENTFTETFLPTKYDSIRGTGKSLTTSFVDAFIKEFGEGYFTEVCKKEKIDRSYFVNTNADISILFIKRLLQELKQHNTGWNPKSFSKIVTSHL